MRRHGYSDAGRHEDRREAESEFCCVSSLKETTVGNLRWVYCTHVDSADTRGSPSLQWIQNHG